MQLAPRLRTLASPHLGLAAARGPAPPLPSLLGHGATRGRVCPPPLLTRVPHSMAASAPPPPDKLEGGGGPAPPPAPPSTGRKQGKAGENAEGAGAGEAQNSRTLEGGLVGWGGGGSQAEGPEEGRLSGKDRWVKPSRSWGRGVMTADPRVWGTWNEGATWESEAIERWGRLSFKGKGS